MADSTVFDLSGYPPPTAIEEVDSEVIIARMRDRLLELFPDAAGVIDLEDEPLRILIETFAGRETLVRERINYVVWANLLAGAQKSDLDHLAAFYGVVRLPGELDDAFKRRVILAIQGRSTGGTAPRYRSVALGASVRVADAVVYRDGDDPTVYIAVYAADNNGVADEPLLALVRAAVNDPAVRMVNDTIVVRSAVFSVVDIEADIWLLPETPDSVIQTLSDGLRAAWTSETGLGFDLVRAWISARLMKAGVQKVAVISPAADVVASPEQAISIRNIVLNNRGRAY
ncbi:hypothetical protein BA190_09370 [Labrys sp. WJW]|uniref:baseplate assembly protein n=1 Tax=Labrys sp. WJW TaxID=1737983 RepID=UPI000832D623|nr:baseplate J/gp47 family protein [Labrys sp. WJW]OCC05115.1 hypothetical protein BA190_09370 [Labrys sp. WJW]